MPSKWQIWPKNSNFLQNSNFPPKFQIFLAKFEFLLIRPSIWYHLLGIKLLFELIASSPPILDHCVLQQRLIYSDEKRCPDWPWIRSQVIHSRVVRCTVCSHPLSSDARWPTSTMSRGIPAVFCWRTYHRDGDGTPRSPSCPCQTSFFKAWQ